MARRRPRDLLPVLVIWTIGLSGGTEARAQGTLTFTSTPVAATADALAAGPDGSLWTVSGAANSISHVTFPDLHVSTFSVPTAAAGLTGIAAGPDGNMWFTEADARKIGRITASGAISEFPIPASAAAPQRIFAGPGGALWSFNACFASGCSRFVITTTGGGSTEVLLGVPSSSSFSPVACALGADGNVWCIGTETTPHPFSSRFKVARITPAGGYAAFAPSTGTQGSAIVAAPDGNVWYAWELPGGSTGVARVSPAGAITEFPIPTGNPHSWVFGLAVGADGNLYCGDRQTNILYELVLSTATDSGTASFNSGTIALDIPEDLVAVSTQHAPAGVRVANDETPCPPGTAFIARSGGSSFGGLEWETTEAPTTCTDLVAGAAYQRYEDGDEPGKTKLEVLCFDVLESKNDATRVVLQFTLKGSGDSQTLSSIRKGGWDNCSMGTFDFQCTAAAIPKGESRMATAFGTFGSGGALVTCRSQVAEMEPEDNQAGLVFGSTLIVVHIPAIITRRHS